MNKSAIAYLDECGDSGWKLDLPYQKGGSSRFFVVGMVLGIDQSYRRFPKIIAKWHKKQGYTTKKEKKWHTSSHEAKVNFLKFLKEELDSNEDLVVMAVVLNKSQMPTNIDITRKGLQHLMYAYALVKLTSNVLNNHTLDNYSYCPDELNESYKLLESILEYEIVFKQKNPVKLTRKDMVKPMTAGLTCADMIAGAVWESIEHNNPVYSDILKDNLKIIDLL